MIGDNQMESETDKNVIIRINSNDNFREVKEKLVSGIKSVENLKSVPKWKKNKDKGI